ncbi:MAG: hypothetical protein ACYTG0_07195 [Planctomycetota bacterium]|jgi:hypothetical protein
MTNSKRRWVFWLVCAAVLAPMAANHASGLGTEELGNKKLSPRNYEPWPGLAEVVNDPHRVYQKWVNGNENCYYQGDTKALNLAIQKFSEAKFDVHRVVLLPGPGEARTFDGKKIPCDWRLHVLGGIAGAMAKRELNDIDVYDVHPTLYVFVNEQIDLKKLSIPAGVKMLGTRDLRQRYYEGIEKGGKHARGYGAMFLSQIDTHNKDSAQKIVTLLDEDDRWLTAMAISCLERFGANAQHLVQKLAQYQPADARNAEKLKEVITSIKEAEDRSESDNRRREQMEQIEDFLRASRK